jgi:4-hydroxy-3-methylbut-2-enyl diphosphate reductase
VSELLIAAPLRLEAALIRSGARGARVQPTGMGRERSRAAARRLSAEPGAMMLVAGFCGALDDDSRPGDVIVADEVFSAPDEPDGGERVACEGAGRIARALTARGIEARSGPIVCVSRLALGERRSQLRAAGAIAVDMESVWLAPAARGRPFAVLRVVLDSPTHELLRPGAAVSMVRAARVLRRAAAAAVNGWGTGE